MLTKVYREVHKYLGIQGSRKMCQNNGNDAVRYSRTGDIFHYRWVALKCLDMINPLSNIEKIKVEGSGEDMSGEFVIDVTEYLKNSCINYYQMKHTVQEKDIPATISFLKKTLEGFAQRYKDLCNVKKHKNVSFYVITNRIIDTSIKDDVYNKADGKECSAHFDKYIKQYTNLDGPQLRDFCSRLILIDECGDYEDLRHSLYVKTNYLLAGQSDDTSVIKLESMVRNKALPSDGIIIKEDILKCLGYPSVECLFPAQQMLEKIEIILERKIYKEAMEKLSQLDKVIVHASGGVGKSIFAQYIKENAFGEAIIYDCFGAGTYRNRSRVRHGFKTALTQIVNELASIGLCDFMLVSGGATENEIMRMFLQRISQACEFIKQRDGEQKLYIVIDAADNAEMAAEEYGEHCFAHELLRESMPDGCCLVMLCRTERRYLLKPTKEIIEYELLPFSDKEVAIYLMNNNVDGFSKQENLEVYRLTGGNPRVIANALSFGKKNKREILAYLGPKGTNVAGQIEYQLQKSVDKIKDSVTGDYRKQIDSICFGLAVLPPFIPVSVLAKIADVDKSLIKSFIADMGRAFWMADDEVIQFRDEPVETWFREKFVPDKGAIKSFAERIKSQAHESVYVAETLPMLYLRAECLEELITLALKNEGLPDKDRFDNRNVKLLRYKYAFRAALKAKRYKDTVKIAFLAAKETAGNQKLNELLKNNVDLVTLFSEKNVVQELAFSRVLQSRWQGSENVYISSLLSCFPECKGETRAYLRASKNWMLIYLEEQKKDSDRNFSYKLENKDISELGYAIYNYVGIEKAARFLVAWQPKRVVFEIVSSFISRLVDQGKFSDIDDFSLLISNDIYGMMAVCNELDKVGKSAIKDAIKKCWEEGIIDFPEEEFEYSYSNKTIVEGLLSFIEQSLIHVKENNLILDLVKRVLPIKAGYDFVREEYSETKSAFLRGRAIKKYLGLNLDEEDWIPEKQDKKKADIIHEILFPLYDIRIKLLLGEADIEIISQCTKLKDNRIETFQNKNNILNDIAVAQIQVLLASPNLNVHVIKELLKSIQNIKLKVEDEIAFLRGIVRNAGLHAIWDATEQNICQILNKIESEEDNTNELPEWYLLLARAVLSGSKPDAHEYYNMAIESINGFGEEMVSASRQMIEICDKCAGKYRQESKLAELFIKYTEKMYDILRGDWYDRGAIRACIRLSPADGFAAISRFREMDEYWTDRLFEDAAIELISTDYLSASEGWALSAFLPDERIKEFSQKCSEYEEDPEKANVIRNIGEKYYQMMVLIKQDIISKNSDVWQAEMDSEKINEIFENIDLLSQDGLKELFSRIRQKNYKIMEAVYIDIFNRVTRDKRREFLDNLIDLSDITFGDFLDVIKYVPQSWNQQPSIQRNSNDFIYKICKRWCSSLLDRYYRQQLVENMPFDVKENESAFQGFMDGLALIEGMDNHRQYIEYISVAIHYLTSDDAKEVLGFALNMFLKGNDEYIEENGSPYEDNYPIGRKQLAGFIYTALGSPVAKTRWEGVHAVVRLAKMGCIEILQELMSYDDDVSGVFIEQDYVHYKLHSILYLLIALYRIAKEDVNIVIPFKEKLVYYASEFMDHALIQRICLETIKLIYKEKKEVFEKEEYEKLMSIAVSSYPVIDKKQLMMEEESGEQTEKYYFGYDMTRYWFGKLGEVFGVSEEYIARRVQKIIIEQWKVNNSGSYKQDPRESLWEGSAYRERIYHSHGSYPSVDTYNFYLSYHGMMVVADQLLKERPTVEGLYDEGDPWEYWIKRHLLSRNDGYFLSDMRGKIPHDIETWYAVNKNELWISNIDEKYFLSLLMYGEEICVNGSWKQKDGKYQEEVYITSALVEKKSAESLVSTLMGYKDSNDYKLPEYQEEENEYDISPFILKGLVKSEYPDARIDGFDPWAEKVRNCLIEIGDEYRKFISPEQQRIQCWSFPNNDESMNGERLLVAKNALKAIVESSGLLIILEVGITRNHTYQYNRDDSTYKSPKHRIYLFNGKDIVYGEV